MKTSFLLLTVSATLLASPLTFGQSVVRETTTIQPVEAVGTVTEFAPDAIVVRSESGSPIRYSFSESTEYVDEAGNRVSREVVHSGAPVTITYVKEGDRAVARRVVVRKQTGTPEAVTTKKTTTTTTTKE